MLYLSPERWSFKTAVTNSVDKLSIRVSDGSTLNIEAVRAFHAVSGTLAFSCIVYCVSRIAESPSVGKINVICWQANEPIRRAGLRQKL